MLLKNKITYKDTKKPTNLQYFKYELVGFLYYLPNIYKNETK